jgi:hypothetical protein
MKTTKEKIQKLIKKKKDFTLSTHKKGFKVEVKKYREENNEFMKCDNLRMHELDFFRPKEIKRVFEFNQGRLVKQTVYYKQHE